MACRRIARLQSLGLAILIWTLLSLPALAVEPITLTTRLELPADSQALEAQVAVLAGLYGETSTAPTALALVWAEYQTGFFPTWNLQLHSDSELLPQGPGQRTETHRELGTRFVNVHVAGPQWGHTYETILSFDPNTGDLSVWVENVTTNEVVFRELFRLPTPSSSFHVTAPEASGVGQSPPAYDVPFEVRHVEARFIPHATQWGLVPITAGQPGPVDMWRLDRSDADSFGIRLRTSAAAPGTFHFYLEGLEGRTLLAQVAPTEPTTIVPLPADELPLGAFDMTMEYSDGATLRLASTRRVTVGQVRGSFTRVEFSAATGAAWGTLNLGADGPFPPTQLRVDADLYRLEWDETQGAYAEHYWDTIRVVDEPVELGEDRVDVAIQIPNPAREAGVWRVDLQAEIDTSVPFLQSGGQSLFGTHAAPPMAAEGPFTVAVLPDTQYYSYRSSRGGHPDIFLRQLEWIAAQAESEQIALTLHVGDITDHNSIPQWEVAQRSIYLLDGVIPYVLTVGNHDLGPNGSASTRETLFNRFFPAERYQPHQSFGGLYTPQALENSYHTFTLGGTDYLVLALEFLPRDEVLAWANDVVAAHPDHWVILITHYYVARSGEASRGYGTYAIQHGPPGSVNSGHEVWEKLVRKHPNMLLVMSGHLHHDAMPRQVLVGDHGNPVYHLLIDYQFDEAGGNGWLALLRFFPEQNRIGVGVYSPYLGEVKYDQTDGFDVPFCIDLTAGLFVPADAACQVVPGSSGQ